MKAAIWGAGLIMFGLFALVMVNLFGNITVTNQFNYTTMKNAVQAAMYDSLDIAHYRSGFCLCTTDGSEIGTNTKVFSDKGQYKLSDIQNGVCESETSCALLYGEYRIDPTKFPTILEERFSNMITNDKGYDYIIKEIIEYPPKVSVKIVSHDDEFFPTEKNSEGYDIVNQIDAIIETNSGAKFFEKVYGETQDLVLCFKNGDKVEWGTLSTHKSIDGWNMLGDVDEAGCKVTTQTNDGEHCYLTTVGGQVTMEWGSASKHKAENGWKVQSAIPKSGCKITKQTRVYTPTGPSSVPNGSDFSIKPRGCFLPGTKIVVKDGYTEIDKLKIDDYVLTYNEKTKTNEYKKVKNVFVFENIDEELYTIKTDNQELQLTGHHRIYTIRNGQYQYIAAEELKIGDVVMYANGKYHYIIDITHESINKTVYNLETEDNHNFYVGNEGILVHNMQIVQFLVGGRGNTDTKLVK